MRRPEYCSDDTLRIETDDRQQRASIAEHLRASACWLECVEGMHSVVVQFDAARTTHGAAMQELEQQLATVPKSRRDASPIVEVPVCYGGEYGPELASIAEMLEISEDAVIRMHTSRRHEVELIGFTPGFAYVSGLGDELRVPRLSEPRQRVAPGSVGVAGGLTGLYALPGPGGWPLIGRTAMQLFRADESQPMVLRSGTRIQFVAIDEQDYLEAAAS